MAHLEEMESDSFEALHKAMRDPSSGLNIQDRKWLFKTYKKCFRGNLCMKKGFFYHVTRDHAFKDEALFYRFVEDEKRSGTTDEEEAAKLLPRTSFSHENCQPRIPYGNIDADHDITPLLVSNELDLSPLDEHNKRLIEYCHPPNWNNPVPRDDAYNFVVIGAGPGGLVAAAGAAGLGAKVALIERHLTGGDCLNYGCVPSKAFIAAGKAAAAIKNGRQYGISVNGEVHVDFAKIMERMRSIRADLAEHDACERFSKELRIDVFVGSGKFTSKDTVEVNGRTLKFARAVIATGARAAAPAIPGLKDAGYLTNQTVFNLTQQPRRLAVIGTGAIGLELGQCFARLGTEVHVFSRSDRIMVREEPEASEIMKEALLRDGVIVSIVHCGQIHQNTKYERVEVSDSCRVMVISEGGVAARVEVDDILVAAGRAPNVEGLGLESAGVKYCLREGVHVSDSLQTSNSNIFAVGDVCGKYKFTHVTDFMARIAIKNALFFGSDKVSNLVIPWVTYTEPEVAHVGLYEHDLKDQKSSNYQVFQKSFDKLDRAVLDGHSEGFIKVLTNGSDQIVGCTIVGHAAGEMISEVCLAMTHKIGLTQIAATIHPYPTTAECIRQMGDEYNRTRLTPVVRVLLRKLLAARR